MFEVIADLVRYRSLNDCKVPPDLAWSLEDCKVPTFPPLPPPVGDGLRPHPDLRTLSLDEEYAVAFVPSRSRVAVVNRAARELLLRGGLSDRAVSAEVTAATCTLAHLGLLSDGDDRTPATPPEVLAAWLHVTNDCNLRCGYCYIKKSREAMSEQTGRAAIDATIRSAIANGFRHIALKYAGGEATLNMGVIERVHRYATEQAAAHGLSLQAGVLSNGTTLTPRSLQTLRDLGLRLMISLDGLDGANDQRRTASGRPSAHLALRGIEAALATGLTPDISVTVTDTSVDGLPALVGWLLDHELPFSLNFYRQHAPNASLDELLPDEARLIAGMRAAYAVVAERPPHWSVLGALLDRADLSAPHDRACAAGQSYLVFDQRGRVATCQMEIERPVTTAAAPDPLALIRLEPIGAQHPPVAGKADCASCAWRHWCAGGCPVATVRATGRYDTRSPNCAIYRALYPDLLLLEGRRLLHHHRASTQIAG